MADNVIEENVIDKIQVKGKEYSFGIKYDSERNIINETYFRRDEMPQIEEVIRNAQTATSEAEKVDATITDANVLEVTDRTGIKKSLDMSGLVSAQDAIDELQSSKIDKTSIAQELGEAEDKMMSQKATSTELNKKADKTAIEAETKRAQSAEQAIIYDVSALNNGAVFESLSVLLSSSNLSTLIPTSVRHGGMTIRFVQSSDNKYVQYRLMSTSFSTNEADWQGDSIIGTDRIADGAVTTDKLANPNTIFVLNIDNPSKSLIDACNLANAVVKHMYIDLLAIQSQPDIYELDENGMPQIYLRQIMYEYEGVPDKIWLVVKRIDGSQSLGHVINLTKERGVVTDSSGSVIVSFDKTIIPLITSKRGQLVFNNEYQIKLNLSKLETEEFYELADGAITTDKIAGGAVTNEKLADGAITENNLPSLNRNFATSVELRKCGFYCNNFNTGNIVKATSEIDGLIVPIMFDNIYLITGDIPYKYKNVAFYSDYPSTDTFILSRSITSNRIMPVEGSKYAVFTILAATPFKAFACQSFVDNDSINDDKIKDASITFSKKIINPILHNAPYTASIIKEFYISKEDIPADAKDVENPIFCLGQILYTFGTSFINNIGIRYLTNKNIYAQAFVGKIQTKDAEGNNAVIKFGKASYAKINFSELKDMGIEKNTQVLYDNSGKYPFISSVILNRQFSANSIPDRSIPNEKLETDLTELNDRLTAVEDAVGSGLSNIELFTIGDSLVANGIWQKKTAEILNIVFDQNKNIDPSFPLSIGGTTSDMSQIGTTYFRVKNLVTKEYIKDSGENAIIVLECVNDGTFDFNPADRTYKMDKQYSIASLSQEQLNLISNEDRVLNAVAGVRSLSNGKKLTITALPIIEGDITIKTGWDGPGVSTYNIHVIPQESDDLTRKYVVERIIEYSYKGIFDTAGEDGNSVYFTNSKTDYETTLEFTDTGGTGMVCSVETVSDAPWETFYWYNGKNTEDENWGNTLNWVKPTKSSAWKSSIEELLRLYPKAHIFIANFPAISKAANDYYDSERDIYDEKGWYDAIKERKDKALSQFKAISEFYNIPLLDVWDNMNMSVSNWNTFYPIAANIHPLKDGYERWGILIAALLKNFI